MVDIINVACLSISLIAALKTVRAMYLLNHSYHSDHKGLSFSLRGRYDLDGASVMSSAVALLDLQFIACSHASTDSAT
jgi:hypothetical protein